MESGGPMERLCELGLEYRHIAWYLAGKYASFEEFQESLARAIQKFAKRQTTWFKRDDAIHWLDMEEDGFTQACGWIEPFCHKESRRKKRGGIALYGNKCPWP